MDKQHVTHQAKHAGFDLLAGIFISVFYKPKTAAGYAFKGAITGLIVYQLMHDAPKDSETPKEH
jgi:hypothetical protein